MGLVEYSSSDTDSDAQNATEDGAPARKKIKTRAAPEQGHAAPTLPLPALPSTFRDLYSSTVRTSTQDDPSLHAGRLRVTPHVVGNWPAHVYLEWHPNPQEAELFDEVIARAAPQSRPVTSHDNGDTRVHSLVKNDLDVPLPLHVSLSRPLVLRSDQKDAFASQLKTHIANSGVQVFVLELEDLIWHPNEDRTRWFLVLRLQRPRRDELRKLLSACNSLVAQFGQPLLYEAAAVESASSSSSSSRTHDSFHISIAWSLRAPHSPNTNGHQASRDIIPVTIPQDLKQRIDALEIPFDEVKLRIGQDVLLQPLRKTRVPSTDRKTNLTS